MSKENTSPADAEGWRELDDHDLLASMVADQLAINRLEAARLAKIAEFEARRAADYQARKATNPYFTMTPLRETAVEVAPLIGQTEGKVKADLATTRVLQTLFPGIWDLVTAGQLDVYRASKVTDAAMAHLTDPAAIRRFAEEMTAWFGRHLEQRTALATDGHEDAPSLVGLTVRQIGNRVAYLVKKLQPRDADERFGKRFADRSTRIDPIDDGMAQMVLTHDVASLTAVDHRLSLLAKQVRRDGDPRSLEQLRTDLAVDLLLGRLTADPVTGELINLPALGWARPVINVTVPIQTLMGVTDDPGILNGNQPLPAGLVRAIAQDPTSTWYRMLTDPARHCIELSVTGYKPTGPILRQVIADQPVCVNPTCDRAASGCELDHRTPAPEGATSTINLSPACHPHHQAKHAPGYGLTRHPEGGLVFHTAAGFTHPVPRVEQPVADSWGDPATWDREYTCAQVRDALAYLAHQDAQVDSNAAWIAEVDQAWADYRASYPDATDEEIWAWIHDDDPTAPEAPPILTRGTTPAASLRAEQQAAAREYWRMDDQTRTDLYEHELLERLTTSAS